MLVKDRIRGWEEDRGGALVPVDVSTHPVVDSVVVRHARDAHWKIRRIVVCAGVALGFVLTMVSIFCAALPTSTGILNGLHRIFEPQVSQVQVPESSTALIVAQGATATAVTEDGYEYQGAGGHYNWAGVQRDFVLPDGSSTGMAMSSSGVIPDRSFHNQFTPGQCTYWANYEYHHLTGYAVPWGGNAATWADSAAAYGWNVSTTPHLYSIIVLQPGVQGAGWAGHVGVVEKINSDGSVATTNWNVRGWGVFSWETYWPGQGVLFIWHP